MDYFNKFDFRNHDKIIPNEIDGFFTKQQLNEMSDYEKNRFKNLRQNYEVMVLMGLTVKKPSFMTAKWKRKKPVVVESEPETDEEWKPSQPDKKKIKALKQYNPFKAPYTTAPVSHTVTAKPSRPVSGTVTATTEPISSQATEPVSSQATEPVSSRTTGLVAGQTSGPIFSTVTADTTGPIYSQTAKTPRKRKTASFSTNQDVIVLSDDEDNEPRYALRQGNRNFMNVEVPDDDEFIYCEDCNKEYPGDCPVHGSYIIIHNAQIELTWRRDPNGCFKTLPDGITIKDSNIPNAGKGAFATKYFSSRSRFGPYGGEIITDSEKAHSSGYCWQIYQDGKHDHFIDAQNPATSNWMRYVNCARTESEQNVTAYQYQGQIYYRTFKDILPGTEILVWYGSEYASELGIHRPLLSKSRVKTLPSEPNTVSVPINEFPWQINGSSSADSDVYPCLYCHVSYDSANLLLKHVYSSHYECLDIQQLICHCLDMVRLGKMSHEDSKKILEVTCRMNTVPDNSTRNQSPSNTSVKPKPIINTQNLSQKTAVQNGIYTAPDNSTRNQSRTQSINTPNQKSTYQNVTKQDEVFQCQSCDLSFTDNGEYCEHLRTHNTDKNNMCNICNKTFSTNQNLQTHIKTHTEEKPYTCDVCSQSFSRRDHLQTHIKTHNEEKPYTCKVCSKAFNHSSNLKKHTRTHAGEKPDTCNVCNKTFSQNSDLKKHIRTHSGEKPYTCTVCSKTFSRRDNLQTHIRTHSGEKPYTCDVCSKSFGDKSNLQKHVKTHTEEKPYKCNSHNGNLQSHIKTHTGEKPYESDVCNKPFSQNSNLQLHNRTHTRKKTYKCNYCNKTWISIGDLTKHIRIHTGEKPFTCQVCSKSFSQLISLKTHIKTHNTEDKPFKCDACSRSFNQSSSLQTHMRTHTEEKPYKCDACSRSFSQLSSLKTHMRTHSGEKPYTCTVCSKSFSQSSNLKKHMRTHTGEKPFKCDACGTLFTQRGSLKLHIRTLHSLQNEV